MANEQTGEFDWATSLVDSTTQAGSIVRLLLYGPTGAGKTYLMGQFPGLYVIDTDRGMRTLKDKKVPYHMLESGQDTWKQMTSLLNAIRDKLPPFDKLQVKTLGVDSATKLAKFLMEDVMRRPPAGMSPRNPTMHKPEWDHYSIVAQRLYKIMMKATDLGLNFVATAGVKVEKDEVTGAYIAEPNILGGYRHEIGHDFDEFFYMEPETAGGKTIYKAYTTKYGRYNAKSRDGRKPIISIPEKGAFEMLYGDMPSK